MFNKIKSHFQRNQNAYRNAIVGTAIVGVIGAVAYYAGHQDAINKMAKALADSGRSATDSHLTLTESMIEDLTAGEQLIFGAPDSAIDLLIKAGPKGSFPVATPV